MNYPDQGAFRFLQPRDFGGVIRDTFVFLRETGKELGLVVLAIVGPVALALPIASTSLQSRMQGFDSTVPQADPFAFVDAFVGPYLVLLVVSVVVQVVTLAVVLAYVRLYRRGEAGTISPGVAWEEARGLIWPVVSVSLVVFAVAFGLAMLNVIPCLGTIAFLVLIAYFMPSLTVATAARVFETDGGWDAFARGRELVKGEWAQAFGAVFVTFIIGYALSALFSIPAAIWGGLWAGMMGGDVADAPVAAIAITSLVSTFGGLVFYMLVSVMACVLHGSLKEIREGSGLMEEFAAFEGPDTDTSPVAEGDFRDDRGLPPEPLGRPDTRPSHRPGRDASSGGSFAPRGSAPQDDGTDSQQGTDGRGFRGGGFGDAGS